MPLILGQMDVFPGAETGSIRRALEVLPLMLNRVNLDRRRRVRRRTDHRFGFCSCFRFCACSASRLR